MRPLFELGVVAATPGALDALAPEETLVLLRQHQSGDWGDVPLGDVRANDYGVRHGLRILSAYSLPGGCKVWIITEADRSATTILLPEEY